MQDEINKALDGTMSPEDIAKFEASMSDVAKAEYQKAKAFRTARQDEERKLNDLKGKNEAEVQATSQFRKEQFAKAKSKFFTDYKIIDPAEQLAYEKSWEKTTEGAVDPDNLYGELEGVYALRNKTTLLQARRDKEEMEKNAFHYNTTGAIPPSAAPFTPPPEKKYSAEAVAQAKRWGIPVEAAQKRFDELKTVSPSDTRFL